MALTVAGLAVMVLQLLTINSGLHSRSMKKNTNEHPNVASRES
jgi:hypothetical protein